MSTIHEDTKRLLANFCPMSPPAGVSVGCRHGAEPDCPQVSVASRQPSLTTVSRRKSCLCSVGGRTSRYLSEIILSRSSLSAVAESGWALRPPATFQSTERKCVIASSASRGRSRRPHCRQAEDKRYTESAGMKNKAPLAAQRANTGTRCGTHRGPDSDSSICPFPVRSPLPGRRWLGRGLARE
jgi:hypothetical protein